MKFYCIDNQKSPGKAAHYLKNACESLGAEFVELIVEKFDATKMREIKAGDAVYRISTDKRAREIEKYLVNKNVVSFYDWAIAKPGLVPPSYAVLKNSSVSMPKTISVSTSSNEKLKKYVDYLGGFPIVIKVGGLSQGVGIIKVDSLQGLYSIVDFLNKSEKSYVLREFIDTNKSARLVVLGGKVIASIEYSAAVDDFRSNNRVNNKNVKNKRYAAEIERAAIDAARLKGLEFGGVDILIDKNGKHYVLEVNFPFSFPDVQAKTGVDIALKMISHLKKKGSKPSPM